MKMTPECIPCLLRRTLAEVNEVDPDRAGEVMNTALKILAEGFPSSPASVDLATVVHRATYDILGDDDPYSRYKARATEVAKGLMPIARELVSQSADPFSASVLVSIVGNVLDFGISGGLDDPSGLETRFLEIYGEGLGEDHVESIRGIVQKADRVAFFTDNCGEILFDTLLIEQIGVLGAKVDLVVKGEPILTDATYEDATEAGMGSMVSNIYTTDRFYVGVDRRDLDGKVGDIIGQSDLVIAKGMGNYESFTETDVRPIAYLLRTKCRPVADSAGLPLDINAAILVT